MYQDENAIKLSKISSVPYDLIIEITKTTVLSSNDLLEFYSIKGRFPTVEEMNVASKVGFSALYEMTKLIKDYKIMSKKNNYRYVAYDAANGDYEEFETLKEAEDWLKEGDGEGISDEACCGQNYIAEIQYRSVVTKTDEKSNYHVHTDECPEDCDKEEWPYSDDFDWIGHHSYEKIDWSKES